MLIGNRRVETAQKIPSINPATLEVNGEASLASSDECRAAVEAARKAFPFWRESPQAEKKKIFLRAKRILLDRSREIAKLITREKGSPYAESLAVEVFGALEALDYYSKDPERTLAPKKGKHHLAVLLHKKSSFHFQPLGPTLLISPWNFPFLIPILDTLSALAGGNTLVLRPSTLTPFSAIMIGEIFAAAGLPPGVLNIVICRVPQAEEMVTNPQIQTVMFTGSVPTGKRIMELASRNLTNVTLELGGKDPMIVLKDADLERSSRGAVWGAFMNAGQSCASIERAYVAREVIDEFTERVLDLTRKLKVGNPLEPGTDMGPMASLGQLRVVEDHLADAQAKGAQLLYGGKRVGDLPGHFILPAVLTGVDHSMKIMKEETFGPTLPIMTFSEPEEALALANDSAYGLTASVWTRNKSSAAWLTERLETGTVTINDHMITFAEPRAIWGGIKQTGRGRSHGPYGLHDLVNIKYVSHDYAKKKTQLWWFPYDLGMAKFMERSLAYFHHGRMRNKTLALFSLLPHLPRIKRGSPLLNLVKSLPRLFGR